MGKNGGKVALGVLGFAFGAGWLGGGVQFGANTALLGGMYGASLASTIWTATHQPDQGSTSYNFDQIMNAVSSEDRIPIIYGTRKWGGNQTYHKTSDDKQSLTKDIVWCEGEIDSITDIRVNDIDITTLSGCSQVSRMGSQTQTVPPNYTTVGGYKNCAVTRFSLVASENLGSNPTCTATIKGKKVTDTRTGTYAYTSNPAMCVRDYLISKRYGAGHFVNVSMLDEDSFKEVADYCDQLVTTRIPTTLSNADAVNAKILELQRYLSEHSSSLSSDETTNINDEIARLQNSLITINTTPVSYTLDVSPRYSLNIIIADKKAHNEILQDMFSVFGGFLTFANGKISLKCENDTAVSYSFNDDNVIQDSVSFTQYAIEKSPNKFIVKFYDPNNQWSGVKISVEDPVDQKERGKVVSKEVDLSGCTSQSQAIRLARMYRDKIKLNSIVAQWQTAYMGMHLEPGDIVTLTKHIYPDGVRTVLFYNMPFRILEISDENGTYTIKGEQYNSSIYNDALGSRITVSTYGIPGTSLSSYAPRITNVIAYTNADNEIMITHDHSTIYNFREYRYYIEEVET